MSLFSVMKDILTSSTILDIYFSFLQFKDVLLLFSGLHFFSDDKFMVILILFPL